VGSATVTRCGTEPGTPPLDIDALADRALPAPDRGMLSDLPFQVGGPPNEEGQGSDRLVFVMRR
jgi:hypothetical protein